MSRMISYDESEKAFTKTTVVFSKKDSLFYWLSSRGFIYCVGSFVGSISGRTASSYSGYCKHPTGNTNRNENVLCLYHAEKQRRKVVKSPVPVDMKIKKRKTPVGTKPSHKMKVRDNQWVVTFYMFKLDRVIKAKQNSRNFEILLRG